MRILATLLAITLFATGTAQGTAVQVEVRGQVIFNGVGTPPLNGVGSGELGTLSFNVDSDNFVDGIPGDVRGYVIDATSFVLSFSGGVSVGLVNPFPAGQTPYFALVDGFPVSDGFFVSTSPNSPGGVPLEQTPINANVDLGYTGDTLPSLDILQATGLYGFTGLTRFSFNLWSIFPDNAVLEMDFIQLSITSGAVSIDDASWGGVKAMFK